MLQLPQHSSPAAFSVKNTRVRCIHLALLQVKRIQFCPRAESVYTRVRVCVRACLNMCKSRKVYFVTSSVWILL